MKALIHVRTHYDGRVTIRLTAAGRDFVRDKITWILCALYVTMLVLVFIAAS